MSEHDLTTPEGRKAHVEALLNDPNSPHLQVHHIRSMLSTAAPLDPHEAEPTRQEHEMSEVEREMAAQEAAVAAGVLNDVIAVVRSRPLSIEDAWAVLAAAIPGIARMERAAALREAADAWAQGAWAAAPRHDRPVADRIAEVWDEGFDAGHQTARAVNPEWPALPTNPHRTEETP